MASLHTLRKLANCIEKRDLYLKAADRSNGGDSMHRILVVDDYRPWRDEVCRIIEPHSGMMVIAEAADGEQGVRLPATLKPDLVVLDIALPGLNGFEAAARIFEVSPKSKVVFLSMQNDPATIQTVLDLGASAYVHKFEAKSHLLTAIRTALGGIDTVGP